jgi:hypothetical protein
MVYLSLRMSNSIEGLIAFAVIATILIVVLQIIFFVKSLKTEKEGFLKITDAAQELNNKTLHDAGKSLFISNQLKYWILYLAFAQIGISVLFSLIISAD